MALADEIAVKLGLSTTQFKAALKDAAVDVKRFSKDADTVTGAFRGIQKTFKELQVLFAAGGLRAVLGFFEELSEKAQKSKDIVDENIDSARQWGDEYKDLKNTFSDFAIQVLGFLASVGRNAGDMLKSIWGGIKNVFGPGGFIEGFKQTADEIIRGNAAEKQTRQDLLETLKTINQAKETQKARADQTKRVAEAEREALRAIKEEAEIIEKLANAKKKLDDLDRDARLKKMTDDQRLVALAKEKQAVEIEIAKYTKMTADGYTLTVFGTEDLIGLKERQRDIEKEITETTEEKAKAEKEITGEIKAQMGLIAGIGGGKQFNDASDAALEEVIRRNNARTQQVNTGANGYGIAQQLELARLNLETANAQKELATRRQYSDTLSRPGGLDQARRNFQGDPLAFDSFISQIQNKTPDPKDAALKGIDDGIQDLNERLRLAGFGSRP